MCRPIGSSAYLLLLALGVCPKFGGGAEFVVRQVADINPNGDSNPGWIERNSFNPLPFIEFGGDLYFGASGPQGRELYKTDGTDVWLLSDIDATRGQIDAPAHYYIRFEDELYFDVASTGVYKTDGDSVDLVIPGVRWKSPIERKGDLIFYGRNGSIYSLSNGQVSQLGQFDHQYSTLYLDYTEWTLAANRVFFVADGADEKSELYSTDGKDVAPVGIEPVAHGPGELVAFGDELFLSARGPEGVELYKTDGENAVLVGDINPAGSSSPFGFVEFQSELYFAAEGAHGRELYKTDGNHVSLVADINPNGDAFLGEFPSFEFGGELFFSAWGPKGNGLYKTNGTSVELVANINRAGNSLPYGFIEAFGELFFMATPGADGSVFQVYKSNGTDVIALAGDELRHGFLISGRSPLIEFAGDLFFAATGPDGRELYKTDGGDRVTLVTDINPEGDSFPRHLTVYAGELFFSASGSDGRELYKLTLAGDADEDGDVEFDDFLTVAANFDKPGDWRDGDFDLDGLVQFSDFVLLSNNFGAGSNGQDVISVPEPSMALNAVMLLLLCPILRAHCRPTVAGRYGGCDAMSCRLISARRTTAVGRELRRRSCTPA